MKKIIIFVILILVVVGLALAIDQKWLMKKKQSKSNQEKQIREPIVAGQFYPGDKAELDKTIDGFFARAELPALDKYIRGLIVPHAGYIYSGQMAAYAYKILQNQKISRVILIGNSHKEYFDGIANSSFDYYQTPLGEIKIDKDFIEKIKTKSSKFVYQKQAEANDHILEVQIPFLQKILTPGWKIVPIILGNQGNVDVLVQALKDLIDENTLVVASSDLAHYPSYKDAQYSDNKVIQAILTGKRENLQKTISDIEKENIANLQTCACGQDAIEVLMELFGNKNIKLLKSANSGDVTRDHAQVVGYAAVVFMDSRDSTQGENELNQNQQKRLLEIAKQSLEAYLKQGKILKFEEKDLLLNKPMGAFVTLKEHGELRGCIGVFQPDIPLYQVVAETVISSAIHDSRFMPITKEELPLLEYEISVLSPLKKIDSYQDVEIGKQGVEIVKGLNRGVFLPQVARENNWDRDTFLSVLCTQKAGLASDCYKDKDTEIWVFTAQVFDEESVK
jgi:AmmeMemoRadiSam system protein B/AmmeMemoRadiSam system protein A